MACNIKLPFFAAMMFLGSISAAGQDAFQAYIETFSPVAIAQQEEFGIPASITLAQGILESNAGRSTLATEGHNHFGIKCHNEWNGPSMLRDDDAPDECFRVYSSAEESYKDHSRFLLRPRYQSLFTLEETDYSSWAHELKKCGYATDPNYAPRLIAIIERYSLYDYDTEAGRATEETVMFIRDALVSAHPVRKSRGLHYVVAVPGDTYASIAKEFHISEKKLRRFNDADRRHSIKEWEEVYLEEKLEDAPENIDHVTIGDGETMHSVSQRYGMQLEALRKLNKKAKDEPGTVLRLR